MPEENKKIKQELETEIAVRNKFNNPISYWSYLPDPDPVLRKLGKDISAYRELTLDSQVFACYQSRKYGVLSKEWSIDRGKAKSKNAETLENLFKKLKIDRLISDILEAPFFGFQPIEIIWEKSDGLILPARLTAKPQEWFRFNNDNNLVLKSQFGLPEELPEKKFLCPVSNGSYMNPYGEKVLSRIFWNVVFKKGGLKFWAYFAEKYGMPTAVGRIEGGQSQDEIDAFADKLNAMVQDAVIVLSGDKSVEFKESSDKGGSSDIYAGLIANCDASISKAILGQTLTTEVGNTGSYAASKTHQEVRQDIVDADTKLAEDMIQQLIGWIYELNWQGISEKPEFELWEEDDVDQELAQRDKTLTETGVKFTKKYFIKNYGFDEEDFEIAETQPAKEASFAESEKLTPQDELLKVIENFDNKAMQEQIEAVLNPVLDLIQNSKDIESAMNMLGEAYPDMDIKELETILTKLIFISEVWGRINEKNT